MKSKCAPVSLVLLLTALLGCETTPRRTYSTELQPHENAAELQAISTEVHRLVNAHRASLDASELQRHPRLDQIARQHSAAMAQGASFSHSGFSRRATQARTVAEFFRASENLAYNFGHADPAARAMESWLDSSAHRREMERGTFRLTGIGVARTPDGKYFFTQLFLHPKR
jgi:uncharacterized protein YkwD